MSALARITIHYIGQGSCNIIETFDGGGSIRTLSVCDMGSEGAEWAGCHKWRDLAPTKRFAYNHLLNSLQTRGGKLDMLSLSHLDSDHVNIMEEILRGEMEKGEDTRILKSIDKVYFGGTPSSAYSLKGLSECSYKTLGKKSNRNEKVQKIAELLEAMKIPEDQVFFLSGYSNYGVGKTPDHHCLMKDTGIPGGFKLYLRMWENRMFQSTTGVYTDGGDINSNSSIVVCEIYAGSEILAAVIFMGDATYLTMSEIVKKYNNYDNPQEVFPFLTAPQRILVAPHHGSLRTACRGLRIKVKNSTIAGRLTDLMQFCNIVKPTTVIASANCPPDYPYRHPSDNVLDRLSGNLNDTGQHLNNVFCCNEQTYEWTYVKQQIAKEKFTTYYSLEDGQGGYRKVVIEIDAQTRKVTVCPLEEA
ncbi:MAG: hypothetical protein NC318_03950 [Blautia sp.]|nr:hypothetical protein [Lachnoclostridium sp.]MCM1210735.1 hypothetical protein [Blautia sp.]